jgi:hypothetical protein
MDFLGGVEMFAMVRRRVATEGLATSTNRAAAIQLLSLEVGDGGNVWTRDGWGRAGAESLLRDKFGHCEEKLKGPSFGTIGNNTCDEPVMTDIVKLQFTFRYRNPRINGV